MNQIKSATTTTTSTTVRPFNWQAIARQEIARRNVASNPNANSLFSLGAALSNLYRLPNNLKD